MKGEGPNALDILFAARQPSQKDVALQPRGEGDPPTEHCEVCGQAVRVMVFRGTKVCSTLCEKKRKGEVDQPKAVSP
jgi:hypothetical protein